jgi:hypothetical protein
MAQFDLLLTQNVAPTGVEFSEKYVNIAKGGLLSAAAGGVPTVLAPGSNGKYLVTDSAEATGLKWADLPSLAQLHTQNTDIGTNSDVFELGMGGKKIELTAESATKFGVKVDGGATYADFQAKDATFNLVTLPNAPTNGTDATNKTYVDTLLAGLNGALLFKGNIKTTGGDITPTAFNALATYNVGWQYRAAEAGTYRGNVCEIGDMITAIVARSGSGATNADWTVSQANIDGAVTGPVSAVADYIATFNGTSGKIIKDGGTSIAAITALISTAQTAANNAIPKATITAADQVVIGSAASTPAALQVNASTIVGRKATGTIAALTAAEVLTILGIAGNVVATGAEIDAGTDNVKYASPLAIANSSLVKGAGTVVADTLAAFNGTTGKLLKASSLALSAIVNWVTPPATKTAAGTLGQVAQDGNFFYLCTALNTWKRSPIATNW